MIVYPNAKINIGLNIVERRADGYHDISTLFYPIKGFCDILEVVIDDNQSEPLIFSQSGITIDCDPQSNLCIKAYHLLSNYHPLPPMKIHLHKIIPIGAGLGGGSADGAFALQTINDLVGKPINSNKLLELALELGSDCPFFVNNTPSIGSGRGEKLMQINLSLDGYYILLVNPGIHVNTGKAYSQSTPKPWDKSLELMLKSDIAHWRQNIINDFEKVVFMQYPEIETIKHTMYELGADYAAMSGSGSTVFGIFKTTPNVGNKFSGYFTKLVIL